MASQTDVKEQARYEEACAMKRLERIGQPGGSKRMRFLSGIVKFALTAPEPYVFAYE